VIASLKPGVAGANSFQRQHPGKNALVQCSEIYHEDCLYIAINLKDTISCTDMKTFHDRINQYFRRNSRQFPWRQTSDPYHILVSEIMLQQTQTERVEGKYETFLEAFPDIYALARSDLNSLLVLWQGLGYNRRALALKAIAEKVVNDFQGTLPDSFDELIRLPGIGRATAGSILAFAFNKPVPFIETNIRRVYIHFFFNDLEGITDSEILPIVEQTLDRENPRQWYYALMDYGAMLAKSVPNPNRKSAHYTRQSRFEGSDRQIRGMILHMLVAESSVTEKKLLESIEKEPSRVKNILNDLEKEGFIIKEGSLIRIR
jgi:A/G-specific adenine glycosylase